MRVDEISNIEALLFVAAILAFARFILWLVPGTGVSTGRRSYSEAEITAHDGALPKYFLAAGLALAIGGIHAALKNIPWIYRWLLEAGYGGHLVRDIANSHLVIVVGGTVAATGLTWYALPRVARRPLASPTLASVSFWCTVFGAGGFYVSNVVLGVVLGRMVHAGWDYQSAKDVVGGWYKVPVGITSSVMGIGYWTFVANVLLTAWAARRVEGPRPQAHLVKFFVVGALGLFIGTVQGVIQVMPSQARWLHSTGAAGEYIDPIAHAHVNLVTGTLVLIAGIAFAWSAQGSNSPRRKRIEQVVFWTLVPGSLLFYSTFMILGFVEGRLMLREGLSFAAAADRLGWLQVAPLMVAGTWTLAGTWALLATIGWRFSRGPESALAGSALVVAGMIALFVGTLQGLVQLVPSIKAWLESSGEFGDMVVNVHAQLNMIGGVMLALLGLAFARAPVFLGAAVPSRQEWRIVRLAGLGISLSYVTTLVTSVLAGQVIAAGGGESAAIARVERFGPVQMMLGALLYALGFLIVFRHVWLSTKVYRVDGWQAFQAALARYDGSPAPWRRRIPVTYFLAIESMAAFAGFPGFGWIMAGRPLIGVPLALLGPGVAWALVPLLASPYGDGPLVSFGSATALMGYLVLSTALSTSVLWLALARRSRRSWPASAADVAPTGHTMAASQGSD